MPRISFIARVHMSKCARISTETTQRGGSFSDHKTEAAGRKKPEVGGSRLTDHNGAKGQPPPPVVNFQ
jgi:hypothetical protein